MLSDCSFGNYSRRLVILISYLVKRELPSKTESRYV